ncbi:P1 [Avon-Heathcote estuary associated bacilladnavirus]|uniref:Capsid protein n=1 Tax=Avon-Heathcote Estuary associated kieseladnavirus TaxID=3052270 RepID=CAPSD_AHEBV|nr:P1 [Avon-Heathcote estuary associated bacilladnavirus]A0A1P8YT88.1 RecName: Full=Capsid protein [Kieseladnavirus ampcren]AQA27297.1 P1 [Avon-Heathcote estuary associated bacilladnavirus]
MFTALEKVVDTLRLRIFCFSACCNEVNASKKKGKKMSANEIKNQLHVMHDPFSDKTSQPKIPDGKANESLGFATQTVQEVGNAEGANTMHILLFPGQNSGILIDETAQADLGSRTYYIPTFFGSNGLDWDDLADATTAANVRGLDNYALWRVVSTGLQLKLLNPVDQDDGWWESVRVTTENTNVDWYLTTGNNSTQPGGNNGTIAPVGLINSLLSQQTLANEQSYSTGLLRDLHRVQFECHGQRDYHDFIQQRNEIRLAGAAISAVDKTTNYEAQFSLGHDDANDVINQFVDRSYDMVYIRLHCRQNTGTTPFLGSRFHLNCVSNQEVIFDHEERESRFHTRSHTIGSNANSVHMQARRADQNAAKMTM